MPCPTSEEVFLYAPVTNPVVNGDPAQAKPIGITVEAGEDVDFQFAAAFDCSVDISLSVFAPSFDPGDLFLIGENTGKRLTDAVAEAVLANACIMPGGSADDRRKKFENLVYFRTGITELNIPLESFDAPLPAGVYVITLGATPTGSGGVSSYRWTTFFIVP
jgi:hypothetical protein